MREVILVDRNTVTEDGRTVLRERKIHGTFDEDGAFRLLACCGKRCVLHQEISGGTISADSKERIEAA